MDSRRSPNTLTSKQALELLARYFEESEQNPIRNMEGAIIYQEASQPVLLSHNYVTVKDLSEGCGFIKDVCGEFDNIAVYRKPPFVLGNRSRRRIFLKKMAEKEFFEQLGSTSEKLGKFIDTSEILCDMIKAIEERNTNEIVRATYKLVSLPVKWGLPKKFTEAGEIVIDVGESIAAREFKAENLGKSSLKLAVLPAKTYITGVTTHYLLTCIGISNPWLLVPISLGVTAAYGFGFDAAEDKIYTFMNQYYHNMPLTVTKHSSYLLSNQQLQRYLPDSLNQASLQKQNNSFQPSKVIITDPVSTVLDNITRNSIPSGSREIQNTIDITVTANNTQFLPNQSRAPLSTLFEQATYNSKWLPDPRKVSFEEYYKKFEAREEAGSFKWTSKPYAIRYETGKGGSGNLFEMARLGLNIALQIKREYIDKTKTIRALENIESKLQYYYSFKDNNDPRSAALLYKGFNFVFGWGNLENYHDDVNGAKYFAKESLITACNDFLKISETTYEKEAVSALKYHIETYAQENKTIIPVFYLNFSLENSVNDCRIEVWQTAKNIEEANSALNNVIASTSTIEQEKTAKIFLSTLEKIDYFQGVHYRAALVNHLISSIKSLKETEIQRCPTVPLLIEQLEFLLKTGLRDEVPQALQNLLGLYASCGNNTGILEKYNQYTVYANKNIHILRAVRDIHPSPVTIAEKICKLSERTVIDDYIFSHLLLQEGKKQQAKSVLERIIQSESKNTNPADKTMSCQLLEYAYHNLTALLMDINTSDTEATADQYLKIEPDNISALLLKSFCEIKKGTLQDTQSAKQKLTRIINSFSDKDDTAPENKLAKKYLKTIKDREARQKEFLTNLALSTAKHFSESYFPEQHKFIKAGQSLYKAASLISDMFGQKNQTAQYSRFRRYNAAVQATFAIDDLISCFSVGEDWKYTYNTLFNSRYAQTIPEALRDRLRHHWREDLQLSSDIAGLTCSAWELLSPADQNIFYSGDPLKITQFGLMASSQTLSVVDWVSRNYYPNLQKHFIYQCIKEIPAAVLNDFYLFLQYPDVTTEIINSGYAAIIATGSTSLLIVSGAIIGIGAIAYLTYCYHQSKDNIYQKHQDGLLYNAAKALSEGNLEQAQKDLLTCQESYGHSDKLLALFCQTELIKNEKNQTFTENLQICEALLAAKPKDTIALQYKGSALLNLALDPKQLKQGYIDFTRLEEAKTVYQNLLTSAVGKDKVDFLDKLVLIYHYQNRPHDIRLLVKQIEDDKKASIEEREFSKKATTELSKRTRELWQITGQQVIGDTAGSAVRICSELYVKRQNNNKQNILFLSECINHLPEAAVVRPPSFAHNQQFWRKNVTHSQKVTHSNNPAQIRSQLCQVTL